MNFDQDLTFPPLTDFGPFGPYGFSAPSHDEQTAASALLDSAPTGPSPFAIAQWFATKPDKHYIAQWPKADHWNPVIVEFFRKGTDLKVSNDMINWCAAFVNYCFVRTGRHSGTKSASSQSFLPDYMPKTPDAESFTLASSPMPGDIVVFTCHRTDNDQSIGLGHVGFLSGAYTPGQETIPLLAGNTAGNGTYSSISDKQVPVKLSMSRSLGNGSQAASNSQIEFDIVCRLRKTMVLLLQTVRCRLRLAARLERVKLRMVPTLDNASRELSSPRSATASKRQKKSMQLVRALLETADRFDSCIAARAGTLT